MSVLTKLELLTVVNETIVFTAVPRDLLASQTVASRQRYLFMELHMSIDTYEFSIAER